MWNWVDQWREAEFPRELPFERIQVQALVRDLLVYRLRLLTWRWLGCLQRWESQWSRLLALLQLVCWRGPLRWSWWSWWSLRDPRWSRCRWSHRWANFGRRRGVGNSKMGVDLGLDHCHCSRWLYYLARRHLQSRPRRSILRRYHHYYFYDERFLHWPHRRVPSSKARLWLLSAQNQMMSPIKHLESYLFIWYELY